MISKALDGQTLPVYGYGDNIRDWLFVEDHAEALQLVLESGKVGESYNIGGSAERTNICVVETICTILDELRPCGSGRLYREQIGFVADRPGHDSRYAMEASKIKEQLGWTPRETFETGLERTVAWYLGNEAWWRPMTEETNAVKRRGLRAS